MKNRILDAAEELFITQGFDSTSTGDIMKKADIARGTLYNHFKSKEDVLDGVIERLVGQMVSKAAAVASDKSAPVLDRLTTSVMALNMGTVLQDAVLEHMHKPQNALMHQKTQEMLLAGIIPVLLGLVEEGAQQGIFRTDHPKEAIEMIMLYSYVMFDDLNNESHEQRQARIMGFISCAEKLLGTEAGALTQSIMKIFERGSKNENN